MTSDDHSDDLLRRLLFLVDDDLHPVPADVEADSRSIPMWWASIDAALTELEVTGGTVGAGVRGDVASTRARDLIPGDDLAADIVIEYFGSQRRLQIELGDSSATKVILARPRGTDDVSRLVPLRGPDTTRICRLDNVAPGAVCLVYEHGAGQRHKSRPFDLT